MEIRQFVSSGAQKSSVHIPIFMSQSPRSVSEIIKFLNASRRRLVTVECVKRVSGELHL